ncbi:UNVERIFIED_CONTAM: hypothetical protein PYX00_001869 [Menopon gallinae]|uniref:Uncharacterized protein n=1 Tax=Menopon gallinae TaxID=328185 RepID=A0AAW2IFF8_9NEOP
MVDVESKLFRCYFYSSILLIFFVVTFSVPWGHWAYTLDRCTGQDCGCILYGRAYHDVFSGGQTEYCQFVTFAQIPLLLITIVLICYHGVRAYITPRRRAKKAAWRGNPLLSGSRRKSDIDKNLRIVEPPSVAGIISLIATSIIALAVLLTALGFLIDGYIQSCNEYRRMLVRYLAASGRVAYVLNNRLICSSIFDFMDHLQPDRRRDRNQIFDYTRDRINTGLSLLLSIVSLSLNVILWIYILILNFRLLFRKIRKPTD